VSVFNTERLRTPDGEASVIHGYAYRADPKEQGKFTVKLERAPITPCESVCIMVIQYVIEIVDHVIMINLTI